MYYRIILILFLIPIFLFAQTDSVKTTLSEVIVSATKTQTPYYAIGNSVSVVTADEISRKQLNSVVDVLKEMPGLSIYQLGGPGMMAYVNIRGLNTNHTLVIVDGAEMNDPSSVSNAFDFSSLNTNDIERIEIVRGSQSTLYGSDAVAGVVNIFTKKGGIKPSYSFSTEGGSNGFYRGNFSLSGTKNFINYFISAGKTGSDGVSAADSKFGNNEKDGFTNNTVTANINFDFTNWLNVNTLYKYTKFDTDLDQNEKLGDDPNFTCKTEEHIFKGGISLNFFDGNWTQQLNTTFVKRFSNSIDDIDGTHPNTSSASHTEGQRIKFDWQNNFSFVPNNLITFGIETETEKANTNYYSVSAWGPYESLFPRQSVATTGLYLQDQINISNAFFTSLGVRYDNNQKFGGETTFRISPAYFISSIGTKIRTSYGTGFKAPSLYYLFDPLYGNPDLKPEKSKGFDFGIDQFLFGNNYKFSLTYFNMKLENMFGYDANYKTVNIAKASSSGLEFSFSIAKIDNFSLNTNYTYTKTKDEYEKSADYDKPLIRRPNHRFFAAINYEPTDDLNFGLQIRYTGKRDDKDFSNYTTVRVTLPDYTVADLSASYKILDYLRLNIRVENLFDKEYEDVLFYGTLGRSFYAGINFEL